MAVPVGAQLGLDFTTITHLDVAQVRLRVVFGLTQASDAAMSLIVSVEL
mgnify:CR=1 FL=1